MWFTICKNIYIRTFLILYIRNYSAQDTAKIYDILKAEQTYTPSEMAEETGFKRIKVAGIFEVLVKDGKIHSYKSEYSKELIYRINLPEGRRFYQPDIRPTERQNKELEARIKSIKKFDKFCDKCMEVSLETLFIEFTI